MTQDTHVHLDHFCLREPPFTLTPNKAFFHEGGNRGQVLEALLYAARHTEGVITVTGEVGTGKTMLSRMLIERRPKNLEIAYIGNPSMTRDEIVGYVANELRVKTAEMRPVDVLQALERKLIQLYARGRRVMVLIDEAHVIPPDTLEEIRLLSNLETDRHKLLRIVLVGQDELRMTLATPRMRPLRERITERFHLGPLRAGDVADYLSYRLRRAGGDPQTFEPRAVAMIAKASEGLTRRINILADKALLAAFADGRRFVGARHVKAAIEDAQFTRLRGWTSLMSPTRWPLLARFGLGAAMTAGGMAAAHAAKVLPLR